MDIEYKSSFAKFKSETKRHYQDSIFYFNQRGEFVLLDPCGEITYVDFCKINGGKCFVNQIQRCSICDKMTG